jgi:Ca-activated chloride channel family protein
MNKKEKQFEANISRIVKSTKDSLQPSEQFTSQLINEAMDEVSGLRTSGRQNRSFVMKTVSFFIKIAAVLLFIAFLASILMPPLQKAKLSLNLVARPQEVYNQTLSGYDGGYPMANGGTTPPNSEPYDAMFFKNYGVNPFVDTDDDNLSTFATDVDTGSFTLCRQYLLDGHLPPNDAVRVEEFVNYFHYNYPAPQNSPFAVYAEAMPWNFDASRQNTHLMRIGLKGMEISEENRKPAILTFVIDVSGSMGQDDRLGLVKKCLTMLTNRLRPEDKIGIAVYGSKGRKVMDHLGLRHKSAILEAIDSLHPDGSTNAEEGIRIGYDMAEQAFVPGYINRVILCSDGVANVGQTGPDEIFKTIKGKADKGITLSALGFGMGNYNDVLMEQLGDKGNGYYAYIDTLDEAQKLFGENLTGALQVIARDVKIQVEFNPSVVRSYRLIGYENRDVADVDFRNDKVDGGEIGAGHSTTALYELKLWPNAAGTAATVFVRYKDPDTFKATEFKCPFQTSQIADPQQVSTAFALAARVTEFAEILRQSYWAKQASLENTLKETRKLAAQEPANTEIKELVNLMTRAMPLLPNLDNSSVTEEEQSPSDPKLKPLPIVPN